MASVDGVDQKNNNEEAEAEQHNNSNKHHHDHSHAHHNHHEHFSVYEIQQKLHELQDQNDYLTSSILQLQDKVLKDKRQRRNNQALNELLNQLESAFITRVLQHSNVENELKCSSIQELKQICTTNAAVNSSYNCLKDLYNVFEMERMNELISLIRINRPLPIANVEPCAQFEVGEILDIGSATYSTTSNAALLNELAAILVKLREENKQPNFFI